MSLASSLLHLLDSFLKKIFLPKIELKWEIVGIRISTIFVLSVSQEDAYFKVEV